MDYYATNEGQFLTGAHCYLSAAECLRRSEIWETDPLLIIKPTLHLLCHGVELLLKVRPLRCGMTDKAVRKEFGHRLEALWHSSHNAPVRAELYIRAKVAWRAAADSGAWPDDDFAHDPAEVLDDAVQRLSRLHGPETDYALRYVMPPNSLVPTSMFLIDVFGDLADRWAREPELLDGLHPRTNE